MKFDENLSISSLDRAIKFIIKKFKMKAAPVEQFEQNHIKDYINLMFYLNP